jgi:hypothetical protein
LGCGGLLLVDLEEEGRRLAACASGGGVHCRVR